MLNMIGTINGLLFIENKKNQIHKQHLLWHLLLKRSTSESLVICQTILQ